MANQVVGIDLSDAYYMELIVNTKKKKDNQIVKTRKSLFLLYYVI